MVTQAMAELVARALTAQMGLRVRFLAKQAAMDSQAAMAARVVPVDWAALVVGQRQTALTAMAVPVDLVATVAWVAMVPMETRRPRTAEQAAPAVPVASVASAGRAVA